LILPTLIYKIKRQNHPEKPQLIQDPNRKKMNNMTSTNLKFLALSSVEGFFFTTLEARGNLG